MNYESHGNCMWRRAHIRESCHRLWQEILPAVIISSFTAFANIEDYMRAGQCPKDLTFMNNLPCMCLRNQIGKSVWSDAKVQRERLDREAKEGETNEETDEEGRRREGRFRGREE